MNTDALRLAVLEATVQAMLAELGPSQIDAVRRAAAGHAQSLLSAADLAEVDDVDAAIAGALGRLLGVVQG